VPRRRQKVGRQAECEDEGHESTLGHPWLGYETGIIATMEVARAWR
jgi:hypothetical protein